MKPLCPFWVSGITPLRLQIGFPSQISRFALHGDGITLDPGCSCRVVSEEKICETLQCELHNTADIRAAGSYRPSKNGFAKQQNKRGTGPADNIDMFYHREWPEQIGHTESRVSLASG